jgi:hypothetical protein
MLDMLDMASRLVSLDQSLNTRGPQYHDRLQRRCLSSLLFGELDQIDAGETTAKNGNF